MTAPTGRASCGRWGRVRPEAALILGAGGAARAAAIALADAGWSVTVSARRAGAAAEIGYGVEPWPRANLARTGRRIPRPIGQAGDLDALPVDPALLGADTTVIDLAYLGDGRPTALCAAAAAAGATVVSGIDVLVGQGIFAFELFTGLPAPIDAMSAAARS